MRTRGTHKHGVYTQTTYTPTKRKRRKDADFIFVLLLKVTSGNVSMFMVLKNSAQLMYGALRHGVEQMEKRRNHRNRIECGKMLQEVYGFEAGRAELQNFAI